VLFPLERRGYLRAVFLRRHGLMVLVQLGFAGWRPGPEAAGPGLLAVLLFLFFCGFNVLEASQPSLASRVAPAHARGAALGVYNTLQSLGFFAGGAVGGWWSRPLARRPCSPRRTDAGLAAGGLAVMGRLRRHGGALGGLALAVRQAFQCT
jgi:hypothetical protein